MIIKSYRYIISKDKKPAPRLQDHTNKLVIKTSFEETIKLLAKGKKKNEHDDKKKTRQLSSRVL